MTRVCIDWSTFFFTHRLRAHEVEVEQEGSALG